MKEKRNKGVLKKETHRSSKREKWSVTGGERISQTRGARKTKGKWGQMTRDSGFKHSKSKKPPSSIRKVMSFQSPSH
jgi:hypothetical protein